MMHREIIPLGQTNNRSPAEQNGQRKRYSFDAEVTLPGSKYIANRLLPLCALASSRSWLTNMVDNDDINTAISGLTKLGYQIEKQADQLIIEPRQKKIAGPVNINTAHSGTFSRFITAITALETAPVSINCSDKMATRPMVELFDALTQLGVKIDSKNNCLPATVQGPITGEHCQLDPSRSSQYLSALLIVAPLLKNGLTISLIDKLVSRDYVLMTIDLMAKMGVKVRQTQNNYHVEGPQSYRGINYHIPCDPVSASYFMAAAVIAQGKIKINQFDVDAIQGESKFYRVLEQMGAVIKIVKTDDPLVGASLTVSRIGQLRAIDIDMGAMPDVVQTLAVVACFAEGKTTISNIGQLAYKESNRIKDTADALRKTGIKVESGDDYLVIDGGTPRGAVIDTFDDHRMAMSMALLGIAVEGIKIVDPDVITKSFPEYWQYLQKLGIKSRLIKNIER